MCCSVTKVTLAVRDNGQCGDEDHIRQLDALCDVMARVSPTVDDFVLGLYPPLTPQTVRDEVSVQTVTTTGVYFSRDVKFYISV